MSENSENRTDAELKAIIKRCGRVQRKAWLRSRFNIPVAIILATMLLTVGALFSGVLFSVTVTEFSVILAIGAGVLLFAGWWARHIIRIEQPLIDDMRSEAAMARQELHRRRVM